MFGSGARTGRVVIAVVHRPIQRVHQMALIVCSVVVAGTTMRVTAVCRIGTTTRLHSPTATSACALRYSSSHWLLAFG